MPIQATIVLDSGVFQTDAQAGGSGYSDVGYFECQPAQDDFRVYVDGYEMPQTVSPAKLGLGTINVRQVKADGSYYTGVTLPPSLNQQMLRFRQIYGRDVTINWNGFDCTLRFHYGRARCSMVKRRWFKEDGAVTPHSEYGPIPHNVVFHYELGVDEALEMVRESDGAVLYSTRKYNPKSLIELEILADNSTAIKFYRDVLVLLGRKAIVPNQGDPPPVDFP